MALTLSMASDDYTPGTGTTRGPSYDWVQVARVMGPKVHAAWPEPAYCAFRADDGKGPVPRGTVIPGTGAPWVTVCEHGTTYRAMTGKAAHQVNGPARAQWCEACREGKPGTLPLLTATSTPGAVTPAPVAETAAAPVAQTAPAPKATPASTGKAVTSTPPK